MHASLARTLLSLECIAIGIRKVRNRFWVSVVERTALKLNSQIEKLGGEDEG